MIELRAVSHTYPSEGKASRPALREVSLRMGRSEAVALMGATGAGKSTLAQVMAGLIRPTSGEALWDRMPAYAALRGRPEPGRRSHPKEPARLPVAYLFQYPEHQLFEATVFDDVAFGPRNLGLPPGEVEDRVGRALEAVGLDPATVAGRSPFALSGGEQRRAALAGVLALEPEVLVLDEPTAGLDPAAAEALMRLLDRLHRKGTGLVVVTHRMEEVVGLVNRLLVLHQGRLALDASPVEAVADPARLAALAVDPPTAARLAARLRERGLPLPAHLLDVEPTLEAIARLLRGKEP
ncbi:ATP-binding cassette domain-containing protein [Limnochorda pilosa]|uniref:Cobalt ABC transporter ATP-binding protein n=1 Tax=Limnochorda pilosa TaxID=1555112 RepID=A0A0K2SP25_LIMPI|nr:ATP-binding cassette domain-containing protein [Limnochorda pilosa]BAS28856.1 cobalt ABC transporter ATP-binding protein [Limnochorda pilosa]